MLQYPCVHINFKNIKNFTSGIFKLNSSGKPDVVEAPRIEGCVNKNIQEKYNLAHKNLPVYYADMLRPITKNIQCKKKIIFFQ